MQTATLNGPLQAGNPCPEASLGPQRTGRNAGRGYGLITRSGMARRDTLNQRPSLCLEIPPGPLAPPSPCAFPPDHDVSPFSGSPFGWLCLSSCTSPVMPSVPASKKGRGTKKKVARKVDDPAQAEVSQGGPDAGVESEPRPRRSARNLDPELQELAKDLRSEQRAQQNAFEQAREHEIANPTITQPRSAKAQAYKDRGIHMFLLASSRTHIDLHPVWLPSGKKRERKDSEVAASSAASAVKRGRVTDTEGRCLPLIIVHPTVMPSFRSNTVARGGP
ncbi:uncharacterized protein B0H18DRAFT_238738 [Fomitopsis serialis]|uniref:uncharacterized protein n=1 Tax=Fomitopsis serialis TaxID=139415 RepID=UPI0020083CF3|nr:uncharacterized protein B0H18DRAFT_238738 [Neoantrodia serialis]KAH9912720.1 hypothetical protein B0H18DRAFT_238738 [Neoantrodia serialis]